MTSMTASRAPAHALGLVEPVQAPSFALPIASNLPDGRGLNAERCRSDSNAGAFRPDPPPERQLRVICFDCSRPQIIAAESHSAQLSWEKATGLAAADVSLLSSGLQYSLELQQIEGTEVEAGAGRVRSETWKVASSLEDVPAQLDGLRPGHVYAVRVSAQLQQQPDEELYVKVEIRPSPPCLFKTQPTAPGTPSPPSLSSLERKAVKLKWLAPEETGGAGPLTYSLYISPSPTDVEQKYIDEEGFYEAYNGTDTGIRIAKLLPKTKYTFRMKATNDVGPSELSLCSVYTTLATVPCAPDPPKAIGADGTSITLQWVPPFDNGSAVSSYQLDRDDGNGNFVQVYAGTIPTATVGGLRSGVQQRFRLRAENDEGKSMWSGVCVATTAAVVPNTPRSLSVVSTSRMSATMSWQPPENDGGSRVSQYEVELQGKCRAALEHMGHQWLPIFQGHAHACTINSLRPGCTYRARVRAFTAAGWGHWCLPVDICSTPDIPDSPNPPTVTITTQNSISLCWHLPSHDGGSKVLRQNLEMVLAGPCLCGACALPLQEPCHAYVASQGGAVQLSFPGEAVAADVTHLLPGALHFFRLQAVNREGPGPWSDWMSTATAPGLPLMPPPPVVASTTSNSISLHWLTPDAPGAPVLLFQLEAAKLGPMGGDPCTASAAHTMGPGPRPGPYMPPAHAASLPFPAPPPPTSTSSFSGALPAVPMGGHFPLQHMEFRQLYRGPLPSFEAQGLDPATRYSYRVAAINVVGAGPWSEPSMACTAPAPPGAPDSLACTTNKTEVQLSWRPPMADNGSAVNTYIVEMQQVNVITPSSAAGCGKKSSSNAVWKQAHAGGVPFCVISRLLPGKAYQFRVRAGNGCGMGPPCAPISTTMLAAPPSVPLKPTVHNRTATSARIRWEAPDQENGSPVTSYQVELSTASSPSAAGSRSSSPPATPSSSSKQVASSYQVAYFGPDNNARLQDLEPGTRYWVRIAALNDAGLGLSTAPEALTTMLSPPGPPEDVEVLESELMDGDSTRAWVNVRWQPPAANLSSAPAISYEVFALPTSDDALCASASVPASAPSASSAAVANIPGSVKLSIPARGGATKCQLERLLPGTSYAIRLRAVGAEGAGHSSWSHDALFATPGERFVPEPAASRGGSSAATSSASATQNRIPRGGKSSKSAAAAAASGSDRTTASDGSQPRQRRAAGDSGSGAASFASPHVQGGTPSASSEFDSAGSSVTTGKGRGKGKNSATTALVSASTPAAARAPPSRKSLVKKLVSKAWRYARVVTGLGLIFLIVLLVLQGR